MPLKEEYYSKDNIEIIAKETLNCLEKSRAEFNLSNSVLLVLDMQKFFLHSDSHAFIPSAISIIAKINDLITFYSTNKLPIVFTKHANTNDNAKLMSKRWRDILTADSDLCEIDERIVIPKDSTEIVKSQYDAFYNTDLDEIFQKDKISQIVLCGVMTHICVETTARSAFVRGYENFIVIDATATYNYDLHLSALKTMAHCSSDVLMSSDIIGAKS